MASTALGRTKEALGRTTGAQRWLMGGTALALVLAITLGFYLNRPQWVVLVSQADPKDAAAVVAKLTELKVPHRPTGDGYTIMVPKTEQYTAKLALAQAGLPKGGGVGLELFDQPRFGATDFDRRANYLRAQQGELERALVRIGEVEYAKVQLAIPEQSAFIRDQQPVTAAVLIQPRPGRRLTPDQVLGIVHFVAGSVQGLQPERVTVLDESGRMLSNGTDVYGSAFDADPFKNQEELRRRFESSVQSLLEPVFGTGNIIARVNLELNMDTTRTESKSVGNSVPKTVETTRDHSMARPAQDDPARPTTPGQAPTYQGQVPSSPEDQWKTKTVTNYEVSQELKVIHSPAGQVKRLTVGVAINRTELTVDQVLQIKEMVAGATGAGVADVNVTAMPFVQGGVTSFPVDSSKAAAALPVIPAALVGGGLLAGLLFLVLRRREQKEAVAVVGGSLDVAVGDETAPGNVRNDIAVAIEGVREKTLKFDLGQALSAWHAEEEKMIKGLDQLTEQHPAVAASLLSAWLKEGSK